MFYSIIIVKERGSWDEDNKKVTNNFLLITHYLLLLKITHQLNN